jgi:Fe-S-cluster formation regulator IscX/YfhJ
VGIKAYFRREERYEGLQLVFGTDEAAKERILSAIDRLAQESGLDPKVMENCDLTQAENCALYLEFDDDYDREGGAFFEKLLAQLDIKNCD